MDPLYPPGLDENRAADDLYTVSWICSEITLLHSSAVSKDFSTAVANSSAV